MYLVIAQTYPEKGHKGINALIVEKGMPGFEIDLKNKNWVLEEVIHIL